AMCLEGWRRVWSLRPSFETVACKRMRPPQDEVRNCLSRLPPCPRQRVHPTLHARAGVLDVRLREEILGLDLVDGVDRPQEVALIAERHGGIDPHAALELRVRGGPLLLAGGHALGWHERLAATARD